MNKSKLKKITSARLFLPIVCLIAQGTLSADDDNAIQEALDNLVEGAAASVE